MYRRKYGTVPRRKNRTGLHSCCRGAVLSKRVSSRSVFLHIEIVPRTPRWSWPNAQIQSANPYRSNEVHAHTVGNQCRLTNAVPFKPKFKRRSLGGVNRQFINSPQRKGTRLFSRRSLEDRAEAYLGSALAKRRRSCGPTRTRTEKKSGNNYNNASAVQHMRLSKPRLAAI